MESAKTRKKKTRVTLSVCLAVNEGKRKEEREKIGKEMKKEYASFLHFWKKWGKRKENK